MGGEDQGIVIGDRRLDHCVAAADIVNHYGRGMCSGSTISMRAVDIEAAAAVGDDSTRTNCAAVAPVYVGGEIPGRAVRIRVGETRHYHIDERGAVQRREKFSLRGERRVGYR